MRWRDRNWRGDRRRELGLALRWALAVGLVALALVLGQPTTALGATFTVNTTADTPDLNPGDGNCADASGACSLRAAIMEANALGGGPHTIVLQAGQTYTLSRDDDGAEHQTDSGADNDDLDEDEAEATSTASSGLSSDPGSPDPSTPPPGASTSSAQGSPTLPAALPRGGGAPSTGSTSLWPFVGILIGAVVAMALAASRMGQAMKKDDP
jgi:CSLREA domain-containing protein